MSNRETLIQAHGLLIQALLAALAARSMLDGLLETKPHLEVAGRGIGNVLDDIEELLNEGERLPG